MSRLALYLLGPPQIECDGVPVKLDRRKAIALLAYLAVTGERQRRDSLVNLLWPEYDSTRGRAALRRTLYSLRKTPAGAWLDVDREEIGLQPRADASRGPSADPSRGPSPGSRQASGQGSGQGAARALWVDVDQFRHHLADCETHGHPTAQVCPDCVAPLTGAVDLVRGEFLTGFGLKDSLNFDDWQLFQTELLRREQAEALERLVHWHSGQREFEPAIGYAKRMLALDPLDEGVHRRLMRLYSWSGRRSAALRQYEACVAVLEEQLGVPPQEATAELVRTIQEGQAPPLPEERWDQATRELRAEPPSFLEREAPVERPVFVTREGELAELDGHLNAALAGQGKVVFVTGEAGSGKTALIQEFARRAQDAHPDLVVAGGQGNAHTGVGDPYLPFREILGLLSGDVEAQWAAGAMTREQARRLWHLLPLAVEALVKAGPDLIDLFVPGAPMLERAEAGRPWPRESDWLGQLESLVARKAAVSGMPALQQSALFEQYTQVLRALADQKPLFLAVDDLQWADSGSLLLLFHLGRRLVGSRILLVGAYRPAELALGRPTSLPMAGTAARERHPLEPIINELKRTFGELEVNLAQTEGRRFVDALLDSEPNLLDETFREALHQRTRGHPLFTVELLRGMQERGDLAQDGEGRWVEGPALDWETLPARVEAVVAERIGRLPPSVREHLSVASVEGETFTAEVVARVQATGEREMVRCLSETLDRQHRLVRVRGIRRLGAQRLSRYRFRHILFQKYLYSTLDQVERAYLHEQVGMVLEELYKDREIAAVAVQLARHFQEAGSVEKAIRYLHQAGERAVQLSAYQEVIAHLTRGLALLMSLPDSPERDEQELTLQLALGAARIGHGTFSPEVGTAYARARELGQRMGKTAQLCQALGELTIFHYVRTEYQTARALGEEALSQAQRAKDAPLVAWGHWLMGVVLFSLGEYTLAKDHLDQVIDYYVPEDHHRALVLLPGADAGLSALAYAACCLWCLGYPEQASRQRQKALTLARELGHPFSLADVLCFAGCMFDAMRRDAQALKEHAEELMQLAAKQIQSWWDTGTWYRGQAVVMLGQVPEGMAQMREGMAASQSRGVRCYESGVLCSLAEAQATVDGPEEGLATLAEALDFVEQTDEHHWEAELYRVRAELLLMQGKETEAEISLQRAIEVARRQNAKSWELRATTSLARLWQAQGRIEKAHLELAEIYGWFTEGFDTPDLQEAKALLEELGKAP